MAPLFRFPKPRWLTQTSSRTAGVYISGSLFSLALYLQISSALFSASPQNYTQPAYHVTFLSWIPLICSALGMLVINLLDKASIAGDPSSTGFGSSGGGSEAGRQWLARFILFLGFALIAGGLAGSVTILVLKFVTAEIGWPASWMGIGGVVANGLVMGSCIVLWWSQNVEDDYSYNLQL